MNGPWWKDAVFYQIYPRSFKDSNGDGVGDLPGIISRLDYLVALGVDALWVSPFFASPMDDFGYDISDYCDVDPTFGTLADADRLIAEAHKRKLRIVFDLVINHTSDRHPWFVEARSSKDNPKHDWYIWKPRTDPTNGRRRSRPNNWVCQFEFKSAWWDNPATDEWYLATFTRHQPEVNWRNPELREAMYGVIRFWLDRGVDGFRMDVVNWYVKDDQYRSNPPSLRANPDIFQRHVYDRNRPETHDICREIRRLADGYPGDRVLIGEIFVRDPAEAASYQGNGSDELHLAFNMELLFLKWNARAFARALEQWYGALPPEGWPNVTLGNHDQPRLASRLGARNARVTDARVRLAAMLLLSVRGTPFIYYGEEIGMKNVPIPRRELVDPTGITFWPLPLGRDGERTPMQWNPGPGAGFTEGGVRPWLRIPDGKGSPCVEEARRNPLSLWHWYRSLIELRKRNPALAGGNFLMLSPGKRGLLSFRRTPGDEKTVPDAKGGTSPVPGSVDCYLNFSGRRRAVTLPADGEVLLGSRRNPRESLGSGTLVLAPYEALLVSF